MAKHKQTQVETIVSMESIEYILVTSMLMPVEYCKWLVKDNGLWYVNNKNHDEFKRLFPMATIQK